MERRGGEGLSPDFYRALSESAWTMLKSYIAAILTLVALVAVVLVIAGAAILAAPTAGFEALAAAGIAAVIIIILILLVGMGVSFYFLYRGAGLLREALREETSGEAEDLMLPVTIIYYSAILGLIGVATLIILVGAIPLIIAEIGTAVGVILLGLKLRGLHQRLETPGTLLAVGAVLRLAGVLIGILALVGAILEAAGLYSTSRWAQKLAEEAEETPPEEAGPGPA